MLDVQLIPSPGWGCHQQKQAPSVWHLGLSHTPPSSLLCFCKEEGGEANWRSWGSSLLLSVVMKVTLPEGHHH